jgi:hypothetical protein
MAGIAGARDLLKTLCKNVILNALYILFWEFVVFDAYVFFPHWDQISPSTPCCMNAPAPK